jgi:hypothetical protein
MGWEWRNLKMNEHYGLLIPKDDCPKCKLGKGLRKADAIELGWTGWEHYDFLHCDICGAYYCGKGADFIYLPFAKSYKFLES